MSTTTIAPKAATTQTTDEVRKQVKDMLLASDAFKSLAPDKQVQIAHDTVNVVNYLANPEGIVAERIAKQQSAGGDAYALGLSDGSDNGTKRAALGALGKPPEFKAQGAREGAAVAGLYLQAVNFPNFVSGLINGVFHAIVTSSIEQMEAYGKLVADVAKTLNQFRDENVTENEARDHLVSQYPDTFEISIDTGEDGAQPRVKMKDGADESAGVQKVKDLPVDGGPVDALDDDTVESKLVPAARTQLATSRQQLLATMVLMGINRIVVTDGKIQAKVTFDFKAKDTFHAKMSAQSFQHEKDAAGNLQYGYTSEGTVDSSSEGGEYTRSRGKDTDEEDRRDASYYTKGTYKNAATPVISAVSAMQSQTDADLQTKATLSGLVDVNFKSDYLPLEKMADSFQISQIQNAAKPGPLRRAPGAGAAPTATGTPAAAATPPAATPAAPATPAGRP
jgi:hypothetical protein